MKNTLIAAGALVLLAACKQDRTDITPPDSVIVPLGQTPAQLIRASEALAIPAGIAVPPDAVRSGTFWAEGYQRYEAKAVAGTNTFAWGLVGPQAALYDSTNATAGSHGYGPHWTLGAADSLFGAAFDPARTAPSPVAGSIDWLLLQPKPGTTPTGKFAGVRFVQRIATEGGKAPATAPTALGQSVNVPYKVVYRFSK